MNITITTVVIAILGLSIIHACIKRSKSYLNYRRLFRTQSRCKILDIELSSIASTSTSSIPQTPTTEPYMVISAITPVFEEKINTSGASIFISTITDTLTREVTYSASTLAPEVFSISTSTNNQLMILEENVTESPLRYYEIPIDSVTHLPSTTGGSNIFDNTINSSSNVSSVILEESVTESSYYELSTDSVTYPPTTTGGSNIFDNTSNSSSNVSSVILEESVTEPSYYELTTDSVTYPPTTTGGSNIFDNTSNSSSNVSSVILEESVPESSYYELPTDSVTYPPTTTGGSNIFDNTSNSSSNVSSVILEESVTESSYYELTTDSVTYPPTTTGGSNIFDNTSNSSSNVSPVILEESVTESSIPYGILPTVTLSSTSTNTPGRLDTDDISTTNNAVLVENTTMFYLPTPPAAIVDLVSNTSTVVMSPIIRKQNKKPNRKLRGSRQLTPINRKRLERKIKQKACELAYFQKIYLYQTEMGSGWFAFSIRNPMIRKDKQCDKLIRKSSLRF
ncbi:unnamed protein product [Orchesella dallaii]|uniref:Uncharacterized protein n=1 Tax=Orchesella dallaii TaxID=48710 RepID=A0ABP1QZH8_9HEXA